MVSALILALAHQAVRSPRSVRHAGPERVEGLARAVDGDTLDLDGTRIRLLGIDAPELHQSCEVSGREAACGLAAKDAMVALLDGPVRCSGNARDRYRRRLATCRVGDRDLGEAMVRAGHALSTEGYDDAQESARAGHLGIWAGRFEEPAQWRREHRHDGRPLFGEDDE